MELTDVRTQIDSIDTQLLDLFCRRMDLAQEVAAAKKGIASVQNSLTSWIAHPNAMPRKPSRSSRFS